MLKLDFSGCFFIFRLIVDFSGYFLAPPDAAMVVAAAVAAAVAIEAKSMLPKIV